MSLSLGIISFRPKNYIKSCLLLLLVLLMKPFLHSGLARAFSRVSAFLLFQPFPIVKDID